MSMARMRDIIATVAPGVATALGGPLAGVATRAVADKLLGRPAASDGELEAAILGATPADLIKLKELETEFLIEMEQAGIELEKIAADDRASARDRQVKTRDYTPAILAVAIITGFFGTLAYLIKYGLPADGNEVLLVVLGALGGMTAQVGNFYFGSSAGSKSKDTTIANLRGVSK